MSRYHRIPITDSQTPTDHNDDVEYELESPQTPSKSRSLSARFSQDENRALWWITVGIAVNAVILLVNVYLSVGVGSKIALLKERPLSELPRPDPLYGVKNPG